jgi:hypothetical protein
VLVFQPFTQKPAPIQMFKTVKLLSNIKKEQGNLKFLQNLNQHNNLTGKDISEKKHISLIMP